MSAAFEMATVLLAGGTTVISARSLSRHLEIGVKIHFCSNAWRVHWCGCCLPGFDKPLRIFGALKIFWSSARVAECSVPVQHFAFGFQFLFTLFPRRLPRQSSSA